MDPVASLPSALPWRSFRNDSSSSPGNAAPLVAAAARIDAAGPTDAAREAVAAVSGSPDGRLALEGPPPLPPAARAALAAVTDETLQQFEVLVLESQEALQASVQPPAAPRSMATRTERLVASLGPISQQQNEQLHTRFLLLAAHGPQGTRDALSALLEQLDKQTEASQHRQRQSREEAEEVARRSRVWQQRLSPLMSGAKVLSAMATFALLTSAAPAGLAIAGVGAALGAGGALALRRDAWAEGKRAVAWAAVDGALLGATLVGAVGAPVLALCRGQGPWLALGIGCRYALEREAIVHWELGARVAQAALRVGFGTSQFLLSRQALDVRNAQACLRIQQVSCDMTQKSRERVAEGLTQNVKQRHHSLNQAQQLLSKRHQTVVRIQAQMRH